MRNARRPSVRGAVASSLESLAAVAVSTVLVAELNAVTPVTGLSVIYLLAVLYIAIRRGEIPALASAVLGVLALNFFFIDPRYHLTVHDSGNVVALVVLLIAAVVVGRLATYSRQRAAEADERARVAVAREREAQMVAAAATSLLDGAGVEAQLRSIERSASAGDSPVRVEVAPAPNAAAGEIAVRLPTASRSAWLYLAREASWTREDQGRIAEALARLIDVAFERERLGAHAAEAEATRRAEVAKTAILHAISHDFRTPLTAINTAASGLSEDDIAAPDRIELVSVVKDEAARLSRLVDDLLDLSKIEAEAVAPNPDWCDLREVAWSAASQARARSGDHPIEFALPSDLPLVRADPVQLERVFANLIDNAVKFSPPDAPVRVSGSVTGKRVVVRVSDRGPGIPRAERIRIFEPFVRGNELSRGSGLGLAICRGFVEANGGRIALQAGTEGETSFAVSLPLSGQPALA
jgi:two-component system, OmpR family, sensor histidine kinase KdpD